MPGNFRKRTLTDTHYVVTYIVDDSNDGVRADLFLKKHYRRKSRNVLQKSIDNGSIKLEGKTLKASRKLLAGDILQVYTPRATEEPVVDLDYKILFEDDHLLVIDKPGNLPVHPAGRFLFNTLVMALREDYSDWVNADEGRDFFLIHRLDRETSGVILVAKSKEVASNLIGQFFDRTTTKKYYAVARGEILDDTFSMHNDIGPAENSEIRLKMGAFPEGTHLQRPDSGIMSALTHFKVLKRVNGMTLLECELETGRQHQIRVHLAHYGNPVVGDKLYGGRDDLFLKFIEGREFTDEMDEVFTLERHALHSRYLKFIHPVTNKEIEIESELPDDLRSLLA